MILLFCWLSQILPTIVDHPDRLGWTGTNLENRKRSRRVPDFFDGRRSFPTNKNSNWYRRGRRAMDFTHYQSLKLLGSSPPVMQVSIFGALSTSSQIHRENQRQNCGDYPIYLGRSAKSKIPDRLRFSRHMITRLTTATTTKTSLKMWIRATSNFIALIPTRSIRQMLAIFSGVEF